MQKWSINDYALINNSGKFYLNFGIITFAAQRSHP